MKVSGSTTSNSIAVLLTIAILVLAWKMVLPSYFSHKITLSNLTTEVDAAKAKLESIEKSKTELSAIKPITDQLLIAVPKGADEPNLISELEAIAVKNSIVLPSISIVPPTAEEIAATTAGAAAPATAGAVAATTPATAEVAVAQTSGLPITISFSVTGSFANLNSFITGLEKSVRFMDIIGLTYGVDTEGGGNSLSLQIQAYQR